MKCYFVVIKCYKMIWKPKHTLAVRPFKGSCQSALLQIVTTLSSLATLTNPVAIYSNL